MHFTYLQTIEDGFIKMKGSYGIVYVRDVLKSHGKMLISMEEMFDEFIGSYLIENAKRTN